MPGKFGVLEIQWVCLYFQFLFKAQLILIPHHFLLIIFFSFCLLCWLFLTVRSSYIHCKSREKASEDLQKKIFAVYS